MIGFKEDGELKIGKITNNNLGYQVILRGQSGQPLWAGRD